MNASDRGANPATPTRLLRLTTDAQRPTPDQGATLGASILERRVNLGRAPHPPDSGAGG